MLSHTIKVSIAGAVVALALAAGAAQGHPVAADAVRGTNAVDAGSQVTQVRHRHHRRHRHCYFVRRCGYYLNGCRIHPVCPRRR